jgi:hypothetical protein
MANVTKFFGKVPSKSVKGLPPGIKRERLTAPCADSTGKVWPKGAEFVAQAGGYDNTAGTTYVDAVMIGG